MLRDFIEIKSLGKNHHRSEMIIIKKKSILFIVEIFNETVRSTQLRYRLMFMATVAQQIGKLSRLAFKSRVSHLESYVSTGHVSSVSTESSKTGAFERGL